MKVLHVIDSAGLYGAEQVLLNCVEEQLNLGCEPMICSIGNPGVGDKALEVEARRRHLPLVRFRIRRGPNFYSAYKIATFARRNGFDVIHSHGYKGNVLFGLLPRFMRGLPVVSTAHGWTARQKVGRMALYQWLDAYALRLVEHTVVVSNSMLQLRPFDRLPRVSVIRNGLDIGGFVPPEREARNLNSILIGSAGRLSPEKGFPYLIEALSVVRKAGLDARLIVAGEGRERRRLEELIEKLGLSTFVQLPGYCADMTGFLRKIDTFVVSSLTEGTPMCVLEAIRAGTPIIGTNVGGIPEMLAHGHGGIVVEPGNVSELARAIQLTARDAVGSRERARTAHNHIKRKYDRSVMAKSYCALYTSITGGQSAPQETSTAAFK